MRYSKKDILHLMTKMGSPLPDQLKRDADSLIFDGKVVLVAQWGRDGELSLSFYKLKLTNQLQNSL